MLMLLNATKSAHHFRGIAVKLEDFAVAFTPGSKARASRLEDRILPNSSLHSFRWVISRSAAKGHRRRRDDFVRRGNGRWWDAGCASFDPFTAPAVEEQKAVWREASDDSVAGAGEQYEHCLLRNYQSLDRMENTRRIRLRIRPQLHDFQRVAEPARDCVSQTFGEPLPISPSRASVGSD